MIWRKPNNVKYTELCIFVDNNILNIVNPGEHPEIENKVWNFIYLIIKALAIKKRLFKNFQDYDAFSIYAANRTYFAIRKNYWNQGKVIKGKLIRPIKSCLNYIKATLNPMRIEYQNENFKEIMSEEFATQKLAANGYDTNYYQNIKDTAGASQQLKLYLQSTFSNVGALVDRVLKNSPFTPASADYRRIKISILLNTLRILNKNKKLDSNQSSVVLWKLPKSMSTYIKIILKEFYVELKKEILECHRESDIDQETVHRIIQATSQEVINYVNSEENY